MILRLAYRSFGREPPEFKAGHFPVGIWLVCLVFVTLAAAITLVLNFFSLMAGVLITFLGRDGVRFRFLTIFRHIPIIAITLPILLGYAIWHSQSSLWQLIWPTFATLGLAVILLGLVVFANSLLRPKG